MDKCLHFQIRVVLRWERIGTYMGLFDSVTHNLAEQALDATWYKQQVISHNISNSDTPDYKAKTVEFGLILKEKCKCRYHAGIKDGLYHADNSPIGEDGKLHLTVTTGYETNTNQILDGNNVDMEKEQSALADTQYQYSTLMDYLNNNYMMIRKAVSK